jgi:uncharacterized membrane protein
MSKKYHPIPQPADIPEQHKEDAMGAYFMMFATMAIGLPLPIINILAAIIYYYLNKSKDRFVRFHALQSLLSQIPVTLLNAAAIGYGIYLLYNNYSINNEFIGYLIFLGIVNILYIIYSLTAAVRARKGGFYYFLFFGKYAFQQVYQVGPADATPHEIVNKPPF